jgi:hypothetical protein
MVMLVKTDALWLRSLTVLKNPIQEEGADDCNITSKSRCLASELEGCDVLIKIGESEYAYCA